MFGDFWQNFGLNFPFFGTDRAGGMFGGTFRPEDQMPGPQAPQPQGFPGAPGAPGAAPPGGPAGPGAAGVARPAPTGAGVAQPPMGPVSSPLGPGGMVGEALSAIAPGQQRQPDRFGGGDDRLAELLRQFQPRSV